MLRLTPRLRTVDVVVVCAAAMLVLGSVGCFQIGVDTINHGVTPCDAQTCNGCCNSHGDCLPGDNIFACGANAATCQTCDGLEICSEGSCVQQDATPNPDDGGQPACGPQSCEGCCADGTCFDFSAQTDAHCGSKGRACFTCDPNSPKSACVNGACEYVPRCNLSIMGLEHRDGYELIDFGNTLLGNTPRADISLKNTGDATCHIEKPKWMEGTDRGAFSFNGGDAYELDIEPGGTAKLPVTFTPYKVGSWLSYENGFTFTANDHAISECVEPTPGCRRIVLAGIGQKSALMPSALLLPETVDFGEVTLGCASAKISVLLVNESSDPLIVADGGVSTDRPEFVPEAWPSTVEGWSTGTIDVRFVPGAQGAVSGKLTVTGSLGTSTMALSGTGTSSSARTVTFQQKSPTFADVLYVVRAGTNMRPLQESLAQYSNVLFENESMLRSSALLHAGVISADVSLANAGRLQGASRWVSADTNDAGILAAAIQGIGTSNAIDQGLEAARLALSPPNSSNPLFNEGFLRSGARLGIIFVSDGSESSHDALDSYVRAFRAAARGPAWDRVRLYPIVSGTGCAMGRYLEVTSRGGLCQTLGSVSMPDALQTVAQDLFRLPEEFELPVPADAGAQWSVSVDGVEKEAPIVSLDMNHNSVRFAPFFAPGVAQEVTVTYQTACFPP